MKLFLIAIFKYNDITYYFIILAQKVKDFVCFLLVPLNKTRL